MGWRSSLTVLCLALALTGCANPSIWASDEDIATASYREPGPTRITLLTMLRSETGTGAHSALVVDDGTQRLLFDPAGGWFHPAAPERNDVLFGMNPTLYGFYLQWHARETHHVVAQEVLLPPEQARFVAQRIQEIGPVPKANCSRSISELLGELPQFSDLPVTWFPEKTMENLARYDGIRTYEIWDNDDEG